jgi:hypothetical protein
VAQDLVAQDLVAQAPVAQAGGHSVERRVDPKPLADFAAWVLRAEGVPAEDAVLLADSLVTAELWGHASHGMLRLPWYVTRLRTGAARGGPGCAAPRSASRLGHCRQAARRSRRSCRT